MTEEVERSAASVEEAVEAALEELGITEQEAQVEVLQEPQKGLLGIGSKGAVVRVRRRTVLGQATEEQLQVAIDFLSGLMERLGVKAEVEEETHENVQYLDVVAAGDPDVMGLLIGRHGQTLDAIQELTRAAVQRRTAERCRIVVDVEDYRKRRRAQLVERARDAAEKVQRSGRRHTMEPMTPFERKIVHDVVAEFTELESGSEGQEPKRRVVIRKRR
ncbi:MAG TPA: RNA-binding cell elongation regulator Jag/EloR [Actinomycetota bacterium]